jgi:hypothetical protein
MAVIEIQQVDGKKYEKSVAGLFPGLIHAFLAREL